MCKSVTISYFLLFMLNVNTLSSQPATTQGDLLPNVFMIGENEEAYEKMVSECNNHLLNVCEGSMDIAYNVWLHMVSKLEEFAKEKSFDINGTKLWLTAYWNYNGSIKHLVYYPKPNSKNMDFQQLTDLLKEFSAVYKLPLKSTSCFSHYGSANFPSFANHYFKRIEK